MSGRRDSHHGGLTPESARDLDYDPLADEYDRRYRGDAFGQVGEVIRRARNRARGRALEIGSGTGHWLTELTNQASGRAIGLDISLGMLRAARDKFPSQPLFQADAVRLPFAPRRLGLVACVNALHHFPEPAGFLREAERVTKASGYVLLVGLDAHDPHAEWYIYEYFSGVQAADRQRYPPWSSVREWVRSAGIQVCEIGLAQPLRVELLGEQVFEDPFLARGGTSQLALLSDEAYARGCDRIRRAVKQGQEQGEPARFRTRLDLRFLLGQVEGARS